MTGRRKFFISGGMLTAVGLLMRSSQLLFGAFISRTVGAEGVGLNTLIMTVFAFAVTFATSGISLTVTRLVAFAIGERDEAEGGRIVRGAIVYAGIFGGIATVALFFMAGVLGDVVLGVEGAEVSLRILSISLVPTAMSAVFSGYFIAVKKVGCNAAVQILGQIFRIVFTAYLILKMRHLGTTYAVMALCIGATATEILSFLVGLIEFVIERINRRVKSSGVRIRPVAGMALPLAISAIVRSALLTVEHSLIPKRLEYRGESRDAALASYGTLHGMALPLILYPMAPLSSFAGLLVPEFAEDSAAGREGRMCRVAEEALSATAGYACAVAVFLYFFSEELGYVIYNSYDAGAYVGLLAPVVPIMYLDHVTDAMLKGIGEHVFSMWVNIIDAFLSVILVFVLIPIFGVAGYALVIVGMEIFNFTLSFIRLRKKVKFRIRAMWRCILPLFSAILSAVLSNQLIKIDGKSVGVPLLFVKMTFALCIFFVIHRIITWSFRLLQKKKKCK